MWLKLKNRQFLGLAFTRQKPIGYYYVDFYCHQLQVVIEIDGSSHDNSKEYDTERDAFLRGHGLTVIRISARDVEQNMITTLQWLARQSPFAEYNSNNSSPLS